MNRNRPIVLGLVVLVVGVVGVFISIQPQKPSSNLGLNTDPQASPVMLNSEKSAENSNDSMIKVNTETSVPTLAKTGSYIAYNQASLTTQKNVIFFAASWCPTCRSLDSQISSNLSSIPSGLTILKANYDTEAELKEKYGVTYQHTLVQVDSNGSLIKKWNGSENIIEIVAELI